MPAGSVGADFELGRERALGDLTVDGGPGQSRPDKNGFQANDSVWVSHGHAASCSLLLTASETRQDRVLQPRKGILHVDVLWRSNGGESDGSDSDAPTSAEVEAVGKGEFEAEPAACFKGDAEFDLAVGEDRFHLRIAFEASRHVAHRRARGPVAGHVAGLILALAGPVEPLPALHEAVGEAVWIDTDFGLELERADDAAEVVA